MLWGLNRAERLACFFLSFWTSKKPTEHQRVEFCLQKVLDVPLQSASQMQQMMPSLVWRDPTPNYPGFKLSTWVGGLLMVGAVAMQYPPSTVHCIVTPIALSHPSSALAASPISAGRWGHVYSGRKTVLNQLLSHHGHHWQWLSPCADICWVFTAAIHDHLVTHFRNTCKDQPKGSKTTSKALVVKITAMGRMAL